MTKNILTVSQTFKFILTGLAAGALLLGTVLAYAGPIRAARNVLMGAKATQAVTEDSGEEAAAKTNENLKRLKHEPEGTFKNGTRIP